MSNHYYYVFESESVCLDSITYIGNIIGYPLTSVNYEGVPNSNKQKTIVWDEPFARATDGKWVYKALSNDLIQEYPTEFGNYFDTTYPHQTEPLQSDWIA